MDDRQTKITEGAGLEESRLNQEFIDWLNIWGFRILMVVLVLTAGWVGKTRWDQYREGRLDGALVELEGEIATGSPDSLVALAKKYKGIDSVWQQAMLNAASITLESGRKGLIPGGDPFNPDDFLDGSESDKQIEHAGLLYSQIIERAGRTSTAIGALDARSGRVASLISLQDTDGARAELVELIALLDKSGYTDLKRRAEERLLALDDLTGAPMPPSYAELSSIADQRRPIVMYAETIEDVLAIRDRIKSKDLIEPETEETSAVDEAEPVVPEAPAPVADDDADSGQ